MGESAIAYTIRGRGRYVVRGRGGYVVRERGLGLGYVVRERGGMSLRGEKGMWLGREGYVVRELDSGCIVCTITKHRSPSMRVVKNPMIRSFLLCTGALDYTHTHRVYTNACNVTHPHPHSCPSHTH